MSWAPSAVHLLVTLGLGVVVVVTSLPINFAAFVLWAVLVVQWAKRRAWASGRDAGAVELVDQFVTMSVIVLAAAYAPVKFADYEKARHIALPKQVMTIGELQGPEARQSALPFLYRINASDELAGRTVQFPAIEPTVGEFIRAIEEQTPLRHRFGGCGNVGWTILKGGSCAFGLWFDVPSR